MNSHTPPPAFDWREFIPFAKAEARRFYRRLDPGQFKFEDILRVAEAALALSPGHKYARKAIRGALADFVRSDLTIVKPVEMSEDRYLAEVAEVDDCLPTARTARPRPCDLPSDSPLVETWRQLHGVTVGAAPRRIRRRAHHPITGEMHELPSRIATSFGYRVNSKHNKVSVPIECSTYNDDLSQEHSSGQKRAKIDDDEQQEFDASAPSSRRGEVEQSEYRQQRFSVACYNDGRVHKRGLPPPPNYRAPDAAFITSIGQRLRRSFRAEELDGAQVDGQVEVTNPNPPLVTTIRRTAKPPKLTHDLSGRRTSNVRVDMTKFGLEPVSKDKLGAWRDELAEEVSTCVDAETGQREPALRAPSWHRDAKSGGAPEFKGEIDMHPETDTRSSGAKRQARFRERKRAKAAEALRSEVWAEAIDVGEHVVPSTTLLLLRLPLGDSLGRPKPLFLS